MSTETIVSVALADLPANGFCTVRAGEREIIVCRTAQGTFALDNICTHAYARLSEGRLRGTRLICPLHGASFDVRDGRALGAPATRALEVHALAVKGERIEITVAPAADSKPGLAL